MKALSFQQYCTTTNFTLEELQTVLDFHNQEFSAEKIQLYIKDVTLIHDDSIHRNGIILLFKNQQGWTTEVIINDNFEYTFDDSNWIYLPRTIGDFLADASRQEELDLEFTEEAIKLLGR